jgi:hypothetical protein
MRTRVVSFSSFVAAASATVITAVSSWAFVSSTASTERDPFQFASIMNANANANAYASLRIAELQGRTVSTCPNNPEAEDQLAPVCRRG